MSLARLLPVAGTRASLAIDGPAAATFNTVVEAANTYDGPIGNTITLALASGGLWVPNEGTLTFAANVTNEFATNILTLTGNAADTETVTIGATVYTFLTVLVDAPYNVLIGADAEESIDNLVAAIMAAAGEGTLYGTGTVAHPDVEAAAGAADTMDVTALVRGSAGNAIATTDTMGAEGTWTEVTLTGGTSESVTIGAITYNFVNAATTTAYDVEIGVSASATLDNLIACINAAAGSGTVYGSASVVHPQVRAFAGALDTMVVQTKSDTILTAVGTLIATTDECVDAGNVWGAATLADGTNGTNVEFAATGTAVSVVFSSGYTTVSDFEAALAASAAASALMRVKTAGTTPLYQLVVTDDDFTATALASAGASATNSPPTLATQGVPLPHLTDRALIFVHSLVGSGSMTVTLKLWGYNSQTGYWYPLGTSATAANKGLLNEGNAIAEGPISDVIRHVEEVNGLRRFHRLYCEITAIGGTATEVAVYLDCIPASTVSVG